ncbi:MAG: histidine--tRNA ligase [Pseudonocardiaceae bacterium]
MKIDNSPPRGTRDLLPDAVAVRDTMLAKIVEVYHQFGYQRIETPALEDLQRLTGGQGGENEKLIFQVLRRGLPSRIEAGTEVRELIDLGLRFDLTVPLTRFYGNNHSRLPIPFRSFQFGPVWRAERPQKGRYRQFYHCDIDIIGEASVLAEIELIEATTTALAAVGLANTTVRLSDRRYLSALAESVGLPEANWQTFFIGLDKLDKIGWEGVRQELVDDRELSATAIDQALTRVRDLVGLPPGKVIDGMADTVPTLAEHVLTDLATTTNALTDIAATTDLTWEFDPTLVRGMGYYTGQIFEITHPDFPSSLAGGGRYDKLIGRSLGKDVPACGFSIGFERIVDLLDRTHRRDAIAVLYDSDVPMARVLAVARGLRTDAQQVAVIGRGGKLGAQLARLESWGFTALVHLRVDDDSDGHPPIRTLGGPNPDLM